MNTRFIIAATLAGMLLGCTQSTFDPEAEGAALLLPFKQELKGALMSGMQSGPVAAISACSVEAPNISGRLSVDGVAMGRSSHKLRNEENVAPDWVVPLLEAYVAGEQDGPVAVEYSKNRFGYVEPIKVQPMCLNCHGAELSSDVAAAISEQYPNDAATGFSEGDFRAVFWVEFPET